MRPKQSLQNSFKIAFSGLHHGIFRERNSRIMFGVSVVVILISFILQISKLEMLVIATTCFFVIILEMINTSVEKLLDVLYPSHHPEIGLVKDIMSGVVLLGSLLAVVFGFIILWNPAIRFIMNLVNLYR
jgi:diacylglycerol kinase